MYRFVHAFSRSVCDIQSTPLDAFLFTAPRFLSPPFVNGLLTRIYLSCSYIAE